MATKILIISRGAAFMTDALANNLQKSGFVTSVVDADIKRISKERDSTDIYLIYTGNFVFEVPEVLVYLKDICTEDEKMLTAVGYTKEIDELKNAVGANLISAVFERPFDMKSLIEELERIAAINEERKKGKTLNNPERIKIMCKKGLAGMIRAF